MPQPVTHASDESRRPQSLFRRDGDVLKGLDGKNDAPAWVQARYEQFNRLVTGSAPEFPCYFATVAEAAKALCFTYVEEGEVDSPLGLASAVRDFLNEYSALRRPRAALIAFIEKGDGARSLTTEEKHFWDLLQALHWLDSAPWPAHLPTDPDDRRWTFCFAGTPLFITGHCPSYENRLSRRAEGGVFLVIQPRTNLEGITGFGVKAKRVRRRIRSLLANYDRISPSPELGAYGDAASREWKQYWLPDRNEPVARTCPLVIRGAD